MMRSLKPAALFLGLAILAVTFGTEVNAQDFRIEEVSSPHVPLAASFEKVGSSSLN